MHICILLLLMLAPSSTSAQSTPRAAARQFYSTYLKLKVRGLPNTTQRKMLWPLLALDLRQMFDAAEGEQTKFSLEHPDEKPPWSEGDLFSSLFEGAQSFTMGAPRIDGDRAEVPINLVFKDKEDTARWTDTLILTRITGRWRVWDIRFDGDWPFKTGDNLRSVLRVE